MQKRLLASGFLILGTLMGPVLGQGLGARLPELGDVTEVQWSHRAERDAARSIMQHVRLRHPAYLDDAVLTHYLQTLGARLALHSDRPGTPLSFFALRDAQINAFALPGGYIGINTGLILATQSEAELASVLAHEIAHVTQRHIAQRVEQQNRASFLMLASVLMGALAARHNPDMAQAAIMGAQASAVDAHLAYSRAFEREADRIGLQMLTQAGFDPRGMALLFERMQRQQRVMDTGIPPYWQSHPLTTERIAEAMQRVESMPYRQQPDSLTFELARARARVLQEGGHEALRFFTALPNQDWLAVRYGVALAALKANRPQDAKAALDRISPVLREHPWLAILYAQVLAQEGKHAAALAHLEKVHAQHPDHRPLILERLGFLLATGKAERARDLAQAHTQTHPDEPAFWQGLANAQAALGARFEQHQAQAEFYVRMGALSEAINQLEQAQRLPGVDFRAAAILDARLRELRQQWADEGVSP